MMLVRAELKAEIGRQQEDHYRMNQIVEILISWQALLISLSVSTILHLIKATYLYDRKWFKAFMPLYPFVLAVGIVLIPGIDPPAPIKSTVPEILYGVYAGWLSSFSFQLFKSVLKKGFGLKSLNTDNAGED